MNENISSLQTLPQKFSLSLTHKQYTLLQKILPPSFSLEVSDKNTRHSRTYSSTLLPPKKKPLKKKPSQKTSAFKKCLKITNTLKNHISSDPFLDPVDPIALGIPNYFDTITNPMDITTIEAKLKGNRYACPNFFFEDCELVFSNALYFNPKDSDVYNMALEVKKEYFECKRREFGAFLKGFEGVRDIEEKIKDLGGYDRKKGFVGVLGMEEKIEVFNRVVKVPSQYFWKVRKIICRNHKEIGGNGDVRVNVLNLSDKTLCELRDYCRIISRLRKKKSGVKNVKDCDDDLDEEDVEENGGKGKEMEIGKKQSFDITVNNLDKVEKVFEEKEKVVLEIGEKVFEGKEKVVLENEKKDLNYSFNKNMLLEESDNFDKIVK